MPKVTDATRHAVHDDAQKAENRSILTRFHNLRGPKNPKKGNKFGLLFWRLQVKDFPMGKEKDFSFKSGRCFWGL